MKYLLDTSVFLWALAAPNRLNRKARELLSSQRSGLFLSAASSWEIAVKYGLGKLELSEKPGQYVPTWLRNWNIQAFDITHRHALAVGELPMHHQDPFDRVLIVQARMEQMSLLTADRMIEKYQVETFWCGA
jgi:PIN domain nuclease of toxin-antitoxin system